MTKAARLCVLLFSASFTLAQTTQQSFETLKGLAGDWRGKDSLGHEVQVTYRVTGGGSALLSEIVKPNHQLESPKEDMITMFHLDGNRLMMTHYCSAGNQPRMKATVSPDGKTITFDFIDATNLESPQAGHMQRVVIKTLTPERHTEEWIFTEKGKESRELFDLQRIGKS